MADFFDVEKFPGKRGMYKWGAGMWEALLLGTVWPRQTFIRWISSGRTRSWTAFKDNVVGYWGGGAESQSLLMNGDASMALIWSTRAKLLETDFERRHQVHLGSGPDRARLDGSDQGQSRWRGSCDEIHRLGAGSGPAVGDVQPVGPGPGQPGHRRAAAAEDARFNPVDPANYALQIPLNMEWYEANYGAALDAYLAIVSA